MRAMLTLAASLSICAGLFGCDDGNEGHKTAASVIGAASAAPACKCKQASESEPMLHESSSRHRYHRHFRHNAHFGYETGRRSYHEIGWGSSAGSASSYSESSRSYSGSSHSEYAMAEQADSMPPPPPPEALDNMPPPPPASYPPPPPSAGPMGPGPAVAGSADSGVWVDGYGRGHYADGEAASSPNENSEYLSNEDSTRRHDPWRGFNAKCRNAAVD